MDLLALRVPSTLGSACVPKTHRVAQVVFYLDGQRCLGVNVNLILPGLALSNQD